jgi:hypothetical protein
MELLLLWIAEEANLYNVQMAIKKSETFQVNVHGLNGETFHVHGSYAQNWGWKVTTCKVSTGCTSGPTTPTAIDNNIPPPPVVEVNNMLMDPFEDIGRMEEGNPNNAKLNVLAD